MTERELTRRFAEAVADEPPLDVDAMVASVVDPARPRRDHRMRAVASAAATVVIVVGVLAVNSGDDGGRPAEPAPTTVPASPTGTVTGTGAASTGPTADTGTTTPDTPRSVDLTAAAAAMSAVGPEVLREHGVEVRPGAAEQPWQPLSDQYRQQVSGGYLLAATPAGADPLRPGPSVQLTVQHTGSRLDPSVVTRPWLPPEAYPPTETTLPDGSLLRMYAGYDVGSGTQYLNVAAAVHLRTDGIVVHAITVMFGLADTPRPPFALDQDTLVALATDLRLTM